MANNTKNSITDKKVKFNINIILNNLMKLNYNFYFCKIIKQYTIIVYWYEFFFLIGTYLTKKKIYV